LCAIRWSMRDLDVLAMSRSNAIDLERHAPTIAGAVGPGDVRRRASARA
jgi:hypothetical protein